MTVLFSETYIEKGQKRSKPGHKYHFFMFLPVSDYVSNISSPKATNHPGVGPFTTNYVFFPKIYIK